MKKRCVYCKGTGPDPKERVCAKKATGSECCIFRVPDTIPSECRCKVCDGTGQAEAS